MGAFKVPPKEQEAKEIHLKYPPYELYLGGSEKRIYFGKRGERKNDFAFTANPKDFMKNEKVKEGKLSPRLTFDIVEAKDALNLASDVVAILNRYAVEQKYPYKFRIQELSLTTGDMELGFGHAKMELTIGFAPRTGLEELKPSKK